MMARQSKEQMRRFRALTEAQAVLGWGVILVLAALVGTIYVNQASRIATVGRRVQVMQAELSNMKRENAALERQIAEAQRLERLQAEAARLGFIPAAPGDIEYVIIPNYPAEPQPFSLEAQPTATPAPLPPQTLDEALWLMLRGRMGDFVEGNANE
jgi:cell division protein FtsL